MTDCKAYDPHFRHKHEAESGRTSSVGNDILGFDSSGAVVNKPDHGNLDWVRVCEKSSKVITFIDLAGHEKYLKTTVFGMTGHAPDFGMLMVGANAGIVGMTKEHLVRNGNSVSLPKSEAYTNYTWLSNILIRLLLRLCDHCDQ